MRRDCFSVCSAHPSPTSCLPAFPLLAGSGTLFPSGIHLRSRFLDHMERKTLSKTVGNRCKLDLHPPAVITHLFPAFPLASFSGAVGDWSCWSHCLCTPIRNVRFPSPQPTEQEGSR